MAYRFHFKQHKLRDFVDNYGNLLVLYIFFSGLQEEGAIVYGENWFTQNRIYINNTQSDLDMLETLYHEIAHSVFINMLQKE